VIKPAILQRLLELVVGITVTMVVILLFPAEYSFQGHVTVTDAFAGAVFDWAIFFLPFLYPVIVSGVCLFLYARGFSKVAIAAAGAATFLLESAAIVVFSGKELHWSFWATWAFIGISYFVLGLLITPSKVSAKSG